MSARASVRLGHLGLVVSAFLVCLGVAGCSTSEAARQKENAEALRQIGFWQPHQMYLLSSPHQKLYVEVDSVEGCSPSDETLNKFRDFLAGHCQKPGGIEIVRSDIIPLQDARGVMPSALARKYLNGPPENAEGEAPAFLYVLFFNDVVSDRPRVVETGHPGARAAQPLRLDNRNPHVDMLPYPAMIYMNVNWSPKSYHDAALQHEAGHVLGLAFRPTNASAGHCLSRWCLMTSGLHMIPFFLGLDHGLQVQLCEQCLAQLAESQTKEPPSNVRFIGPVLVRSEAGYEVLSLPHRAKVILGDVSAKDCREFAAAVRAEVPSRTVGESDWQVEASGKNEMLLQRQKVQEVITAVSHDPDPLVRRVASRLWLVCAARLNEKGEFANAVDACQRAILAEPEDAQSHNFLAWIRATCPDASVRDANEAVSAATKACKLTLWKDGNWIDTLAAAWAEAGDFKRAIKFQEQALRTGSPSDSEGKDMRERLSMYKQSRPYREKQ